MDKELSLEINEFKHISGLYAWMIMFAGIAAYDLTAITLSKRKRPVQTMSSAFWNLLGNPKTAAIPVLVWVGLSYHLLGDKKARKSYSIYIKPRRTA